MTENRYASKNTYEKRKSKPGRVDLKPQDFNNLIEDQGVRVRIIPAQICPNRTSLTDTNHVIDCPLCGGDELMDLRDGCQEHWAFIQGIKFSQLAEVQGLFDIKDAQITTPSDVRLFYGYKIEVIDFASLFNEIVKRRAGDVDRLRYSFATACDTPTYLTDNAGKKYRINEDFTVIGQDLKWKSSKRPAAGTLYSVTYPILPTFRVIEIQHENRYYYTAFKSDKKRPVQLPQQAVIRWDYMMKGSGGYKLREPGT